MGTVDKGLVPLAGRPMVAHVLERLAPQVDDILINANQHAAEYAAFGYRVIPDTIGGFAGPLAGLQVGLANASHALVATVPCDSPFLPADLVARLAAALEAEGSQLAVARPFDQPHPVFALVRRAVLPHLTHFLEGCGRKIDAGYSAYVAAKGAISALTRQWATEWAKHGITVNAISPTFVDTPQVATLLGDPVFKAGLLSRIPLGRVGGTDDLIGPSLLFCSAAGAFVTGQVLMIDGGLTATQ